MRQIDAKLEKKKKKNETFHQFTSGIDTDVQCIPLFLTKSSRVCCRQSFGGCTVSVGVLPLPLVDVCLRQAGSCWRRLEEML